MRSDATRKPPGRPADGPAARALAEARARRQAAEQGGAALPPPAKEINGRGGPEPVRYGDWEVNGLAKDF
jgi:hypothetical protein